MWCDLAATCHVPALGLWEDLAGEYHLAGNHTVTLKTNSRLCLWASRRLAAHLGPICARSPSHVNPSQRIQESCQSGTKWLMGTQVKVRRKREAQKDRGSPPPSLSQKNTRLCRANRDARVGGNPRLSGQMGLHGHRRQRLRREAALRSPCSSAEPLCSPRQVVSEPSMISLPVPQGCPRPQYYLGQGQPSLIFTSFFWPRSATELVRI